MANGPVLWGVYADVTYEAPPGTPRGTPLDKELLTVSERLPQAEASRIAAVTRTVRARPGRKVVALGVFAAPMGQQAAEAGTITGGVKVAIQRTAEDDWFDREVSPEEAMLEAGLDPESGRPLPKPERAATAPPVPVERAGRPNPAPRPSTAREAALRAMERAAVASPGEGPGGELELAEGPPPLEIFESAPLAPEPPAVEPQPVAARPAPAAAPAPLPAPAPVPPTPPQFPLPPLPPAPPVLAPVPVVPARPAARKGAGLNWEDL